MRGNLVEFVFQQSITRDILAANRAVTYESYNRQLSRFVAYPRSYDKRYIMAGEVLLYRRSDVVNCPGVRQLARRFAPKLRGGDSEDEDEDEEEGSDDSDEDPLPSLVTHAASASGHRGSSPDPAIAPVTPRRSLRLRESSAGSASTSVTPGRAASATSSAQSTPCGGKRKRVSATEPSPRKHVRESGKITSRMVLGKDGEIWELLDGEIEIRMSG